MRIIGGEWKGRTYHVPSKSWPVRPTTDFAREALFNILDNRLDYENATALDLFGGTGIHSVELYSRGCRDITYVDKYRESARFVKGFAKEHHMPIEVICDDVFRFGQNAIRQWDYIFADPPYDLKNLTELPVVFANSLRLTPEGFFVLEHPSRISFAGSPHHRESRHYGQSVFSFFSPEP